MKKLFVLFLIIISVCVYGDKIIETKDDNLVYITNYNSQNPIKGPFGKFKNKGDYCGIIQKYTKDFSQCITSTFGGGGKIIFNDVVIDSNGDYLVVGTATENAFGVGDLKDRKSYGDDDVIFVRFDRTLKIKDVENFGSSGRDYAAKIIIGKDGKCIIVGRTVYDNGELTTAFIASFSNKFKLEKITEFNASFKKDRDADLTEFTNIISCYEDGYIVLGYAYKSTDNLGKSLVLKVSNKLNIIEKKAFGDQNSFVHLTDIAEYPEGGYLAVGYTEENVQKGYVLELTPGFNKLKAFTFMPVSDGKKALYNGMYSIESFDKNRSYLVTGVAVFNKGESSDYYSLYYPYEGFKDILFFPEVNRLSHLATKDNELYVIGYDKDNTLVNYILR